MRITWIGNHEEGIFAFRKTIEKNGVSAFVTLDEKAFGRMSAGSREYLDICDKNNIPVYFVDTIKGDRAYEIISAEKPDLLVVLGWSEILPERLLNIPTIGTVGTHASALPHNRGSAPINWALIHGEKTTGNTMMWLTKDVDAGEIIDQIKFPITLFDTCKTLYERVAETNAEMMVSLIEALKKGIIPKQSIENKSDEPILPRRRPSDGILCWNKSGKEIYDFIRALAKPYPGAFAFLNGKKYIIWKASVLPITSCEEPGTILGMGYGYGDNGSGICVATNDNVIWITEIEDENGNCFFGQSLYELDLKGEFKNE